MNKLEAYHKHTTTIHDNTGWSVSCNKGLWSVSCRDEHRCKSDALHYFLQYYQDGEYNET